MSTISISNEASENRLNGLKSRSKAVATDNIHCKVGIKKNDHEMKMCIYFSISTLLKVIR